MYVVDFKIHVEKKDKMTSMTWDESTETKTKSFIENVSLTIIISQYNLFFFYYDIFFWRSSSEYQHWYLSLHFISQ
jgi:hypothetical protein